MDAPVSASAPAAGETAAASKPRSKAPSPAAAPASSAAPSGTDFRDKYREAVQQIHRLESEVAKATRRSTLLEEERENLNGQLAKVVAVRDRLESLCRHLQERNKELMDKMKEDADKERASREQLVERFSSSVREIEEKIAAHSAERDDILAARERTEERCARLEEQLRLEGEKHAAEMRLRDLELELEQKRNEQTSQLLETQRALADEFRAAAEKAVAEKVRAQEAALAMQRSFDELKELVTRTTTTVREQSTMQRKMDEEMGKLRRENQTLRERLVATERSTLEVTELHLKCKQELDRASAQRDKLQSLCRSLQADRTELLKLRREAEGAGAATAPADASVSVGEGAAGEAAAASGGSEDGTVAPE